MIAVLDTRRHIRRLYYSCFHDAGLAVTAFRSPTALLLSGQAFDIQTLVVGKLLEDPDSWEPLVWLSTLRPKLRTFEIRGDRLEPLTLDLFIRALDVPKHSETVVIGDQVSNRPVSQSPFQFGPTDAARAFSTRVDHFLHARSAGL